MFKSAGLVDDILTGDHSGYVEIKADDGDGRYSANDIMKSLHSIEDDKWLNFRKALYVAFCFLVTFVAFNAVQNMTTEIFRRSGFGQFGYYCLAAFYGSVGLTALFSPAIVNGIGVRNSLVLGAIGHFIFVAS